MSSDFRASLIEMGQKQAARWATVDWHKRNADIARELGVSRQRVFTRRKFLELRGALAGGEAGPYMSAEPKPEMPVQSVGAKIRRLRKARGWQQHRLAKLLNRSAVSVTMWERGIHVPNRSSLEAIARIFDVKPEVFAEHWQDLEPTWARPA